MFNADVRVPSRLATKIRKWTSLAPVQATLVVRRTFPAHIMYRKRNIFGCLELCSFPIYYDYCFDDWPEQ